MNIEKSASGKKLILSQSEWLQIGQKAGWHKELPKVTAEEKPAPKDPNREYWIALAKAELDFESLRDLDPSAAEALAKEHPEAAQAAADARRAEEGR